MLAFVSFPSAYTTDLVQKALAKQVPGCKILREAARLHQVQMREVKILHWCDYDLIDFNALLDDPMHNLASSYTIRKAVTRKHHLPVTIHQYIVKHEHSVLSSAIPKTFTFELAYPEDLDELWFDELYDLDCAFQQQPNKYWLLKAGMAEKGQSIRLFRSKEELQAIVDDFADDTSEDEEDAETPSQGDTKVSLSHMRMWVIQEYIDKPLLVSLEEGTPPNRKFHLRVYVLCVGAIQVYVYDQILALFAPGAYVFPPPRSHHDINAYDLSSHLTNTCLQDNDSRVSNKDQNVHRLSHLVGKPTSLGRELTAEDVEHIIQALTRTTGELFKAAVNSGSHFQPQPNAFEIYGVDFLVDNHLTPILLEFVVL